MQDKTNKDELKAMISEIEEQRIQLMAQIEDLNRQIQLDKARTKETVDLKNLKYQDRKDLEGFIEEKMPDMSLADLQQPFKEMDTPKASKSGQKSVKIRDNV